MSSRVKKSGRLEGERSPAIAIVVFVGIVILVVGGWMVRGSWRINRWIADLDDPSEGMRIEAVQQIEAYGAKAVPKIRQALGQKQGIGLAMAALVAGRLKDPGLVPLLLKTLSNEDAKVRQSAAKALGELKAADAVNPLMNCLDDPEAAVRRNAAWALGQIGEPAKAAAPKLVKLLSSTKEDAKVRLAAAVGLGGARDPAAIEPLVRTLNPKDLDLAQASAEALGKIGAKEAVEPLCKFLDKGIPAQDGNGGVSAENVPPKVRIKAIEALAKIGDKRAIPALKRCADEKATVSYLVREAAQKALQKL